MLAKKYFVVLGFDIVLILSGFNVRCQIFTDEGMPIVQNFVPADYHAESQNWSIVRDKRGIYYIGNSDGVLEFDGMKWSIIPTGNNTIARSLAVSDKGTVFVGASNDFGYLGTSSDGRTVFKSMKKFMTYKIVNFNDIWRTCTLGDEVYFFTKDRIFYLKNDSIRSLGIDLGVNFAYKAHQYLFINDRKEGLFALRNFKLYKLPYTNNLIADKVGQIIVLALKNKKLLIITGYKGLFEYDLKLLNNNFQLKNNTVHNKYNPLKHFECKYEKIITYGQPTDATMLNDSLFAISTSRIGILIFNTGGKFVRFINKNTGLNSNNVYSLYADNNSLLWAGTENGISVVDVQLPLTHFTSKNGLDASTLTTIKTGSYRYVGTLNNLFYLKGLSITKRDINYKFKKLKNVYEDSWYLSKWKDYTLNFSSYGMQLIADSVGLDYKFFGNVYCAVESKKFKNIFFVGLTDGIVPVEVLKEKVGQKYKFQIKKRIAGIKEPINSIINDSVGDLWMSSYYDGIIHLHFNSDSLSNYTIKRYTDKEGLPQDTKNFPFLIHGKLKIATQRGVYKFNEQSDSPKIIVDKEFDNVFNKDSLPIIQLISDKQGRIWYLGKNEAGYLYLRDKKWFKNDSVFKNVSIITAHKMYVEDSAVWLTGSNGIYRYDYRKFYNFSKNIRTFIRKVTIGTDSVLFRGNFSDSKDSLLGHFVLKQPLEKIPYVQYQYNQFEFEYSAFAGNINQQIEFSTKLDGYDKKWSSWSGTDKRRYTNLFEGSYIFMIHTRDKYGNLSKNIVFRFRILPPWYRSIYALIFYVVLLVAIIRMIVYLFSLKLKKDNLYLEHQVRLRTIEIDSQRREIEKQSKFLRIANEELQKLSIVARETDNAVIIMNTNGDFEWVNEGFVKRYKYSFEECTQGEKGNISEFSLNPKVKNYIDKCLLGKKSVSYEFQSLTKNRDKIWAQTTLTPIFDESGEIVKIIAIDTDISKLKHAEAEIYQQKEEIETQRDELQKLNATKDRFFSIIAHDLRGPLGTVINSTGIILENYDLFDDEERKKLLTEIHKSSFVTYNLLENLLNWSRSQRGELKLHRERLDMTLLVSETIELLSVMAANKNIRLESKFSTDFFAYADENTVSAILRNLVSNALKFTQKGGLVSIDIKDFNGIYILIEVCDTGMGIPKEKHEKLFRIDEQTTTLGTNNEKGTGLGLILCSELVQKNEGRIWLESEVNKGTTFFFTLLKSD